MKTAKITLDGGYFNIKKPDRNLVSSIILDCIGPARNISGFERECGLATGSISKVLHGRTTTPMSLDKMQKILNKADKNCHITMDGFAAANGLLSVKAAERLLESLKPACKDIPDYRRFEYKDAELVRYPVPDVDNFERFTENLSFFVENYAVTRGLMLKADELFEDKMLVLSLEKWRCHFYSEGMLNTGSVEEDPSKPLVSPKSLADKYGKVILKSLETMGYMAVLAG